MVYAFGTAVGPWRGVRKMSLAQRFAQVFGIVYLLVGIVGFIPPLLTGTLQGVMGPFAGLLLGLFAVNWFHNVAHLAIGAAGLAVYRNHAASRTYALVIGIAYLVLFLLGILTGSVATLGGLLPLNGADDILHIATALLAFLAYFASRSEAVDARRAPSAR
jgi:hypothetical protein